MPSRRLILILLAYLLGLAAAPTVFAADAKAEAQTYYLFVFSDPAPGKETEYNQWYNEQHAPDVVSVPGFVTAQRFELASRQMRAGSPPLPKYLVVYKIVTPNIKAVYEEVNRRGQNGQTRMSNSVDMKSFVNRTYRTIRPELSGNKKLSGKAAAGTKQTYYQFVFGEAKEGQEQAFNDWYDQHHAPDILAVPGFVWGQRAMFSDVQLNADAKGSKYLMMFRIETGDLNATLDEFGQLAPKMSISPAFDGDRTFGYTYKVIGPLIEGDKVRAERAKGAR